MAEYFVRHGQTDWNLEHRIQGTVDIELNDAGVQQAVDMREKLSSHTFAAIFTSPFKRAAQTAEIITEAHADTPLIESPELAERNFGRFEGEHNSPEGDYYGVWNHNRDVDTQGGESLKDLETRVYPFLDRIRKEYEGKDILLVAHGGIGLIVRQYYKGKPQSGNLLDLPPVANGEVEILEIDERP